MQLLLTEDEARTLWELLNDQLPELRRELARTQLAARELRQKLHKRIELSQRLLQELASAEAPTTGGTT